MYKTGLENGNYDLSRTRENIEKTEKKVKERIE